jgi:hypothetical protein
MYYLLFVPGLCALVIGFSQLMPRLTAHSGKIATAVVATFLLIDCAVWAAVHQTPDNEYQQLAAWAPSHLPSGSTVAVTEYTAQFILQGVVVGQWATIPALIAHHVDYILLSTDLVNQGYGIGTVAFEQYLQQHAKLVFRVNGPSDGSLEIFDVRAITGA